MAEAADAALAGAGANDTVFDPFDPFEMSAGPFLYRRDADGRLVFSLEILPKHCNSGGIVHGGLMMTMADLTICATARDETDDVRAITVSMNSDFLSGAGAGEVIEARGEVLQRTGTMAFMRASLSVEGRPLLNVNAVIKRIRPKREGQT